MLGEACTHHRYVDTDRQMDGSVYAALLSVSSSASISIPIWILLEAWEKESTIFEVEQYIVRYEYLIWSNFFLNLFEDWKRKEEIKQC